MKMGRRYLVFNNEETSGSKSDFLLGEGNRLNDLPLFVFKHFLGEKYYFDVTTRGI